MGLGDLNFGLVIIMASSENEPEQPPSSRAGGDEEEAITPPPKHVDMQKFRLYETRSVILSQFPAQFCNHFLINLCGFFGVIFVAER